MSGMRVTVLVLLAATTVLAGCGRRSDPVAVGADGQPIRPPVLAPGPEGLASGPGIVPRTDTAIEPGEIQRNPNASERRFILDGLLN